MTDLLKPKPTSSYLVPTGLLRDRYQFDGVVCTDWGLLSDAEMAGEPFPARAWGVEHLSTRERMLAVLDAGADQFGGEAIPELLIDLVRSGDVSESRIDESARRLLREKFVLGLFDAPMVDVEAAAKVVGSAEFQAAGDAAQRASFTLLTNQPTAGGAPTLPLPRGIKVYLRGVSAETAAEFATVVETPEEADVAIVRLQAPYEQRETMFENFFHAGSLDYSEDQLEELAALCRTVPTVLDVFLDRPAILTPLARKAAAITANFGAGNPALLDVLFGVAAPQGRLPMDLPRSMEAVQANLPDVPFDTVDPLFRFGHGLSYSN